jgi:hypothetical protein
MVLSPLRWRINAVPVFHVLRRPTRGRWRRAVGHDDKIWKWQADSDTRTQTVALDRHSVYRTVRVYTWKRMNRRQSRMNHICKHLKTSEHSECSWQKIRSSKNKLRPTNSRDKRTDYVLYDLITCREYSSVRTHVGMDFSTMRRYMKYGDTSYDVLPHAGPPWIAAI